MSNLLAQGQERFIVPLGNYTSDQSCNKLEYQTGQNIGGHKRAGDVVVYGTFQLSTGNAIAAGSTQRVIKKVAHGARKDDVIHFTSGNDSSIPIQILSCPDADTMILAATPEFLLAVGDTFDIKRYVSPQYASDGSLAVSVAAGGSTSANQVLELAQLVLLNAAKVASFQEIVNLTNVAQTFTAPAGAKWCKVYSDITNTANIRMKMGGVATATSGIRMEGGRSEDFAVAGDISVIVETAVANQKINVTFGA